MIEMRLQMLCFKYVLMAKSTLECSLEKLKMEFEELKTEFIAHKLGPTLIYYFG